MAELIAHDLVHRSDEGMFLIRDDVQAHLEEISDTRLVSEPQVYINRSCSQCGRRAVTRLADGLQLCETCAGPRRSAPVATGNLVLIDPRRGSHADGPPWAS